VVTAGFWICVSENATPPPFGKRALEGYPEQVEDQDHQPAHHPSNGADDEGEEVDGHVIGQEQVGYKKEDQPDDGVGYQPAYEPHAADLALNDHRPNFGWQPTLPRAPAA
jgi:hypothetical protein